MSTLFALLNTEPLASFLVNLAASLTWDAAKGGWRKVRAATPESFENDFERLRHDSKLRRELDAAIIRAIQTLPTEQQLGAAQNIEVFGDAVHGFLGSATPETQSFVSRVQAAAADAVAGSQIGEREAIDLATAVLIGIAGNKVIANLLIIQGQHQIGSRLEQLQSRQSSGFTTLVSHQEQIAASLGAKIDAANELLKGRDVSSASGAAPSASLSVENLAGLFASYANIGLATDPVDLTSAHLLAAPPLPPTHVPRQTVYSEIERRLGANPVLAITGYQESGKTLAVAGFISARDESSMWFSFRPDTLDSATAIHLLCVALKHALGAQGFDSSSIEHALVERAQSAPYYLILDNVELLENPDSLQFVASAVTRANGRLKVILLHAEVPDVTQSIRLSAASSWRLPGMEPHEAAQLFTHLGVQITAARLRAIQLLCVQCDGHVGMLKLFKPDLEQISTEADLGALLMTAPHVESVSDFLRALISRFLSTLDSDSGRLCRRIAICLDPAPRGLARALWEHGENPAGFDAAWSRCITSVFEGSADERYRLPYLYRSGLRKDLEPDEQVSLNVAAAQYLVAPHGGRFRVDDAITGAMHFLAAGDPENAAQEVTRLLLVAWHTGHDDVATSIHEQFASLLFGIAKRGGLSDRTAIRLLVAFLTIHRDSHDRAIVSSYAEALQIALANSANEPSMADDCALGQLALLMHASMNRNAPLAVSSFEGYLLHVRKTPDDSDSPSIVPLLYAAFRGPGVNPMPFLDAVFTHIDQSRLASTQLWNELQDDEEWYDFWRMVTAHSYIYLVTLANVDHAQALNAVEQLWRYAIAAGDKGEKRAAAILGTMAATLTIDIGRNFSLAVERATTLQKQFATDSDRIKARLHQVLGDALRCAGRDDEAIVEYRSALSGWPSEDFTEAAVSLATLGITLGKVNKYDEALESLRKAASTLQRSEEPDPNEVARYWLEACVAGMRADDLRRALACIIVAHRLLLENRPNARMWVILGQVAQAFECLVTGGEDFPLPFPGFSLGLPDSIEGANVMEPSAPTMLLGRACAAINLNKRAFYYAETSFGALRNEEIRPLLALPLFQTALKTGDVRRICRAASMALASNLLSDVLPPQPLGTEGLEGFVLQNAVTRITACTRDDLDVLKSVHSDMTNWPRASNEHMAILYDTISAALDVVGGGEDTLVDGLCKRSLNVGATNAARALAWYWSFRYAPKRTIASDAFIRWQWRLIWLSRLTGADDVLFLDGLLEQERQLWKPLLVSDDESLRRVRDVLDGSDCPTVDQVRQLEESLGFIAPRLLGLRPVLAEVRLILQTNGDASAVVVCQRVWLATVLDQVLSPYSALARDMVHETLTCVTDELAQVEHGIAKGWVAYVSDISAILDALSDETPSRNAVEGLLRLQFVRDELSIASQANWFLALTQLSAEVAETDALAGIVRDASGVRECSALLASEELPDAMRLRVRANALYADARQAQLDLNEALTIVHLQKTLHTPTRPGTLESAREHVDAVKQRITDLLGELAKLRLQLQDAAVPWKEVWACFCMQAALKITSAQDGLAFDKTNAEEYRERAESGIQDLEAATTVAIENGDRCSAAMSAARAASALRLVDRTDDGHRMWEAANEHAENCSDPKTRRYVLQAQNLPVPFEGAESSDALQTDEGLVKSLANQSMQALGLPEDRRHHIEDDIRKQARFRRATYEHCRHLQPIQNLTHTLHHSTAYAKPTTHVCRCTLLGCETKIETEDADTAILSMIRNYCEGCEERSPLQDKGSE